MSLIDQIRMAQRDAGEAAVMADLKRKGLLIEEPKANSRKDAEAASKLTFEAAWAEMEKRGYRYGRDALAGVKFGWKLHEEWNTAHPPEADKLLQQALEAVLDEHLPGFTEDAPRQHDDVIYDKAIEDAADAIQQLIARTYLENKT